MLMFFWVIEVSMFHHTYVGHEAQTTSNTQIYKDMMPIYLFNFNYCYYHKNKTNKISK